jgi:transposase
MGEVSTIGLDIAKSVFQIHGVDAGGAVVIRKRVTRAKLLEFFATLPACLVGCPPSALVRQIGWVEEGRISGSS